LFRRRFELVLVGFAQARLAHGYLPVWASM
jgi:hypothetical protein